MTTNIQLNKIMEKRPKLKVVLALYQPYRAHEWSVFMGRSCSILNMTTGLPCKTFVLQSSTFILVLLSFCVD